MKKQQTDADILQAQIRKLEKAIEQRDAVMEREGQRVVSLQKQLDDAVTERDLLKRTRDQQITDINREAADKMKETRRAADERVGYAERQMKDALANARQYRIQLREQEALRARHETNLIELGHEKLVKPKLTDEDWKRVGGRPDKGE